MSNQYGLEEIVGELLYLIRRKPLKDKGLARARELVVRLKEMGFMNRAISGLTSGGWSESTINPQRRMLQAYYLRWSAWA